MTSRKLCSKIKPSCALISETSSRFARINSASSDVEHQSLLNVDWRRRRWRELIRLEEDQTASAVLACGAATGLQHLL